MALEIGHEHGTSFVQFTDFVHHFNVLHIYVNLNR
jgi:hypothetical protein